MVNVGTGVTAAAGSSHATTTQMFQKRACLMPGTLAKGLSLGSERLVGTDLVLVYCCYGRTFSEGECIS